MRLVHLRTHQHRNLRDGNFTLHKRISVIHGSNAQGKTNFLEAIYLLSNLQSFRTHRLRDLIAFSGVETRVHGEVEGRLGTSSLDVSVNNSGRQALFNHKKPSSLGEYLAIFPTVLFCPQDLELARGHQELRRRLVDRASFLSDPTHLDRLRTYQKTLRQRNAVLKSGQSGLSVWDDRLASSGARVCRARIETLHELGPMAAETHSIISGGKERPTYAYEAVYQDGKNTEDRLREFLERAKKNDLRTGYTTVGPHRDRITIHLGGGTVDRHGSQGQMRSVALSLKLALLAWGETKLGVRPVFLLDDPGSELDDTRLKHLGNFIVNWKGQVIITSTRPNTVPLPNNEDTSYIRVDEGNFCQTDSDGFCNFD